MYTCMFCAFRVHVHNAYTMVTISLKIEVHVLDVFLHDIDVR